MAKKTTREADELNESQYTDISGKVTTTVLQVILELLNQVTPLHVRYQWLWYVSWDVHGKSPDIKLAVQTTKERAFCFVVSSSNLWSYYKVTRGSIIHCKNFLVKETPLSGYSVDWILCYEENLNANHHPFSPLQFHQASLRSKELAQTLSGIANVH